MKKLFILFGFIAMAVQANNEVIHFSASGSHTLRAHIISYNDDSCDVLVQRGDGTEVVVTRPLNVSEELGPVRQWDLCRLFVEPASLLLFPHPVAVAEVLGKMYAMTIWPEAQQSVAGLTYVTEDEQQDFKGITPAEIGSQEDALWPLRHRHSGTL